MKTNLNELRDKIHKNAVEKGFYDGETLTMGCLVEMNREQRQSLKHVFFAQKIALIHSEVSEALEADRKGKYADRKTFENFLKSNKGNGFQTIFDARIKNTVEDEFADIIIRTLDLCGRMNIDIDWHVEQKMKYNSMREPMHGKKY